MKTRQKDADYFTVDTSNFKQKIKASQSEIMKDFLQISNSLPSLKRISASDSGPRKYQKVISTQRPRKSKTRITEDISPILGLASLINEMDSCPLSLTQEKKPAPNKTNSNHISKKPSKAVKPRPPMKLSGFSRAETHLGIARFISERLKRN